MKQSSSITFAPFAFFALLLIGLNSLSFARTKGVRNGGPVGFVDPVPPSSPGLIYVADSGNLRVQVFNIDGVYQSEFGHSFLGPSGIALYGRSRVYVKGIENCEADEFSGNGDYPALRRLRERRDRPRYF